jgi:hypothetical protein
VYLLQRRICLSQLSTVPSAVVPARRVGPLLLAIRAEDVRQVLPALSGTLQEQLEGRPRLNLLHFDDNLLGY